MPWAPLSFQNPYHVAGINGAKAGWIILQLGYHYIWDIAEGFFISSYGRVNFPKYPRQKDLLQQLEE